MSLEEAKKDIQNLYRIIHGNGNHGLSTRVTMNEASIDQLTKLVNLIKSRQREEKDQRVRMVCKVGMLCFRAFVAVGIAYMCYKLGIPSL